MRIEKLGKVLMVIYGVAGIGTGLIFSKAMYHKGKADAYDDAINRLKKFNEEVMDMIKEKEEEAQ